MIGLIGKKLGHSYSKGIHEQLGNTGYQMIEVNEEKLEELFLTKKIRACNVTIPYKQTVLQYLDEMDEVTQCIGACNTIVLEDGRYVGHNTDAGGFETMLRIKKIEIKDRKVIVLGNGGASKAVVWVLRKLQAKEIVLVKKNLSDETITYEECYEKHSDAHVIINTSPVGMFPESDELVVDLKMFTQLESVVDVVYNPLSTKLIAEASDRGLKTCGGLLMLVAQAVEAAGYFQNRTFSDEITSEIYTKLLAEKQNLVLIGMPGCGKSTIAAKLAEVTGRRVIDLDAEIVKEIGMSIKEYFALYGEEGFRKKETEITKKYMNETGVLIATGGGIVTRKENMIALHQNGFVIWIKRSLNELEISDSRPLSSQKEQLASLYEKRKALYEHYCDAFVLNDCSIDETIQDVMKSWKEGIEL